MAKIEFESCVQAAHKFCDMGCSVFPLRPRDKRPFFKWNEYKSRPATHEEIDAWFFTTPDANLALVCGAISGVVVVDVDGEAGQEWFRAHGLKSNLFQYTSHKHKFHAFYRHPGNGIIVHPSVKDFHAEIDIRGDGSYVVLAPSIHPSGAKYELNWIDDFDGTLASLPMLPEMFWAEDPQNAGKAPIVPKTGTVELEQGGRNAGLTSLCGEWYARGLDEDMVMLLAKSWNESHCDPPLQESEVATIVRSVLRTHGNNNPGLLNTDGVQGWVSRAKGEFSVADIYRDMAVKFASDKAKVRAALDTLEKRGTIERAGNRDGIYRIRDTHVEDIDLDASEGKPISMWLPFGLSGLVNVFPGNVIVIAGETNSGKTSLLLNIVAQNWKHRCRYLSSEMTPTELRGRLKAFNIPLEQWKAHCEFKQRNKNFHDAIDPDAINVIDFLELSDDFFRVNQYITQIFERLRNGIAVVCVQKKRGEVFGRGGEFGLEKARLGLSLFSHGHLPNGIVGSCLVTKCKNFKRNNPDGKEYFYTLKNGAEYAPLPQGTCPTSHPHMAFYNAKERKQALAEIENYCKCCEEPENTVQEEF